MTSNNRAGPTRLFLCLGIFNVLIAFLLPFLAASAVGLSYTVIMSRYRELDINGVIDHQKLERIWGSKAASDWGAAVTKLIREPLNGFNNYSYAIAALFMVNGAFWLSLWTQKRREFQPK